VPSLFTAALWCYFSCSTLKLQEAHKDCPLRSWSRYPLKALCELHPSKRKHHTNHTHSCLCSKQLLAPTHKQACVCIRSRMIEKPEVPIWCRMKPKRQSQTSSTAMIACRQPMPHHFHEGDDWLLDVFTKPGFEFGMS
jgi:hypothetical protein